MPKFFVVSDVHGFYHEMLDALDNAGFDPNNEDHWLISCGDNFDRGPCPEDVMVYLKMLPRKILIKGNHEQLLIECCERGYPGSHDMSNGTFGTINELGDAGSGYAFDECCIRTLARTHTFLDSMVNYFETKNYVFCHNFWTLNLKNSLYSDKGQQPWTFMGDKIKPIVVEESFDVHDEEDLIKTEKWLRKENINVRL